MPSAGPSAQSAARRLTSAIAASVKAGFLTMSWLE
jgi:hypothetical protein